MTELRKIWLPGPRIWVGLGSYCAAVRRAKAEPSTTFKSSFCHWAPSGAADIVDQFRGGLHDRINRHIPGHGRSRKWSNDYQRALTYSARLVNTPRLIIDWLPPDLVDRFHHRLRCART